MLFVVRDEMTSALVYDGSENQPITVEPRTSQSYYFFDAGNVELSKEPKIRLDSLNSAS